MLNVVNGWQWSIKFLCNAFYGNSLFIYIIDNRLDPKCIKFLVFSSFYAQILLCLFIILFWRDLNKLYVDLLWIWSKLNSSEEWLLINRMIFDLISSAVHPSISHLVSHNIDAVFVSSFTDKHWLFLHEKSISLTISFRWSETLTES